MLKLTNLNVCLDAALEGGERLVEEAVRKHCGLPAGALRECKVLRRSIDCRKRNQVHFVMTVVFSLADEAAEQALLATGVKNLTAYTPPEPHRAPQLARAPEVPPVVVGTGPAGLFAALELARAGARPLVLERGWDVTRRRAAVDRFVEAGELDERCNIQFGEGGAGTFSDGKLSTNTHNPLTRDVLEAFVAAGAPADILVDAKPHVGTDLLADIIAHIRQQIIDLGGKVRFGTKLVDLVVAEVDGRPTLQAIEVETVEDDGRGTLSRQTIPAEALILATGHSARDTYRMLRDRNLAMHPKSFSMGVRIEHLQADIDAARYGKTAGHPALGAADYHLSVHVPAGEDAEGEPRTRGVYSFCMCPGGEVVAAASEEGGVVTNGMSRHARDGANANAALLASVNPEDYGASDGCDPLIGCAFQRRYEELAFQLGGGGYKAPAQTLGDFLASRATDAGSAATNKVKPTYSRGVAWTDVAQCLPGFVTDALRGAVPLLERKLSGFADPEAVLTGIESRSSSPVSIDRDETLQASIAGIYPCGEGAGHAGGIMSAAVDGIRCADALCLRYT